MRPTATVPRQLIASGLIRGESNFPGTTPFRRDKQRRAPSSCYNKELQDTPMTLSSATGQRLAPLAQKPAGQLLIHEIYRSIQGESTFAGLPCVFVRLAVCDARCVWCDTPHAFTQGNLASINDVLKRWLEFHCPLVEITG